MSTGHASDPTVSVVIPTWNGERFLRETVESVLAQTYRDFELIVVDDGSADGTPAILEEYAGRLRCERQPNAGQSAARNRGAQLAAGRLLAFLDHDDCWEPTYLESAVSFLDAHPEVGLVALGLRFITADGTPTPRVLRKRSAGDAYTTCSLLAGDVGTIHNPVIRKEVFERAGGYDPTICGPEDCDLWLRLSFLTEMRHLPEPLLLYRNHPGNHSKDVLDNARQWLRVLEKFERLHPEFARQHRALVRRNWAKQLKRLGRELVGRAGEDPRYLAEARSVLRRSIRFGARPRAYLYAGLSFVPGAWTLYARWRRLELRVREQLHRSRLLARLSDLRHDRIP